MNCVFIGDEFYDRSKTMMSPIYKIVADGYVKTDWGKVNVCLRAGESVAIRPATTLEKELFMAELDKLTKQLNIDAERGENHV